MSFNTEKHKLKILFDLSEDNKNIIISQKENNKFIIDNVNDLNQQDSSISVLENFSSDWILPTTIINESQTIRGNVQEFRLIFVGLDESFIPYIHCDVIYRYGQSGIIPEGSNGEPFDEIIGDSNRLQKSEIFQIDGDNLEYISYIRMDFFADPFEIEYKFICYLQNPHYYQSS